MTHTLDEIITSSILFFSFSVLIVHWFRRSRHPGGDVANAEATTFDLAQRLFHWSITALILFLFATGLPLYYPLVVEPMTDLLGLPLHGYFFLWVIPHVVASVLLLVMIIFHILWDSFKLGRTRFMLPDGRDMSEAFVRMKRFFLGGDAVPRTTKYDIFMKSYHALLVGSFLLLGVTGFALYVWAPWWLYPQLEHSSIEPWWGPTQLHDLFGFILVALVVGHTYFSFLPANRPLFRAMLWDENKGDEDKNRTSEPENNSG